MKITLRKSLSIGSETIYVYKGIRIMNNSEIHTLLWELAKLVSNNVGFLDETKDKDRIEAILEKLGVEPKALAPSIGMPLAQLFFMC